MPYEPLDILLPHLATVPAASEADKLEACRTAVRDFCERSLAWRDYVRLLPFTPTAAEKERWHPQALPYLLPAQGGRRLIAVLEVGGKRGSFRQNRRDNGEACLLAFLPAHMAPVRALVAWAPERGMEQDVPGYLLGQWAWQIAQGAKASLMPGNETAHNLFAIAIAKARSEADRTDNINQSAL